MSLPPFAVAVIHHDAYGAFAISIADSRGMDTRGIAASASSLMLADVLPWMERRHIGQLWLTRGVVAALDEQQPGWRRHHVQFAAFHDWHTEAERLDGWTTFVHPGVYGLRHVVLQRAGFAFGDVPSGQRLAQALYNFASAVGVPFYRSPGTTGTGLLRAHHHHNAELVPLAREQWPHPALDGARERPFVWSRRLDMARAARYRYIRAYDRNAQYLAAAGAATFGVGVPYHANTADALAEAVDERRPGYYLVSLREPARARVMSRLPDYFRPDGRLNVFKSDPVDKVWITAPSLVLGMQYQMIADIHDAYAWPHAARTLDAWYQLLRDARARLFDVDKDALAELKAVYTQTLGWLNLGAWAKDPEHHNLYRPDIRHAVIGMARANLYRKLVGMAAGGAEILGVHIDCVYVGVDALDAPEPAGVELGSGLGKWKRAAIPARDVAAELQAMCADAERTRTRAFSAIRAMFGQQKGMGL